MEEEIRARERELSELEEIVRKEKEVMDLEGRLEKERLGNEREI